LLVHHRHHSTLNIVSKPPEVSQKQHMSGQDRTKRSHESAQLNV